MFSRFPHFALALCAVGVEQRVNSDDAGDGESLDSFDSANLNVIELSLNNRLTLNVEY